MSYSRIRVRRGTVYEWSTYNPVLEEGELALEYPDEGIGGLCKFKVGDGSTDWNELGYAFDATSASSIDGGNPTSFHSIILRSGSLIDWTNVNPVLTKNEIVYVTDKYAFKIGDGVTRFLELPYTKSGSIVDDTFDCGDEDTEDEIYSGTAYFEHELEKGAKEGTIDSLF